MLVRNHGLDSLGLCQTLGRNSRLDNFQASILNHLLVDFGEMRARRKQIAERYIDKFISHRSVDSLSILNPVGMRIKILKASLSIEIG